MRDLDPRLERRIGPLRRLPEPRPAALARLRAALRREAAGRGRPIVLTPAAAVAAALAVVALTSVAWMAAARLAPGTVAGEGRVPVQFVLHAPGARSVAVVGDFNDWDPAAMPLTREGGGVWSIVVPLPPGTVRYSFVVDGGDWRADPNAAAAPGDFGRPTSITLIAAGGAET